MAHYKKIAMGIVSVVMASTMALAVSGCTEDPYEDLKPTPTPGAEYGYDWDKYEDEYEKNSAISYNNALGSFYQYYTYAKAQDKTLAERYALMAQSEAKLYASGTLLPIQAQGGNYALSKVANGTVNSTLWGNDSDRLHYAVLATNPIKKADRLEMKAYWNDPANSLQSGVDYIAWVKKFLTDKGYTIKTTYNMGYSGDPQTWDVLATSKQSDSEPVIQTYDGLVEYDNKNQMQPAMATNIPTPVAADKAVNPGKVDADGNPLEEDTVTFTFNIRSSEWVDSQGRKVADFKASDFVTGFNHMLDAGGGLEWLVDGVIVGATEYKDSKDFSQVGVTADDTKSTVTYRVYKSAESYFLTMLGYNIFAPMSKTYYESKGGKFGAEFDASASTYTYGKSKDNIAYCGPFLISEHTAQSKIAYVKNDKWWNKDANARTLEAMNKFFNDTTDETKSYNDFKAETIDGCGLVGSNVKSAKNDKWGSDSASIFDTYAYTSAMDATAFCGFLNIYRTAYANKDGSVASPQSSEERARTYKAMSNVNFRHALVTSIDRKAYQTHVMGEDLAETSINNMYTPGTFVSLPDAVKLTVGDAEKVYPAGTKYGEIVQDQLNADGFKITVWKEVEGAYTYTGFDGWFNADYAKEELEKAITALAADGVTVDKDHPIQIDYPYVSANTGYANRANALKQGIEKVLDGKVKINLVSCANGQEWQDAGFSGDYGSDSNYDFYDLSGWGPDYGDPQSYLDTMLPDYEGYMAKCLGMF